MLSFDAQNYTFIKVLVLMKAKVFNEKIRLLTVYYFCIMIKIKRVLDFYINSSIHVALAVVSLVLITCVKFDIEAENNLLFFIFFATITGYNFVKYFGIAKFHHRRLATWLKAIQIFSFFCFVALCYYTFTLPKTTIVYLLFFGVITFFYAIPFLPKRFFLDAHHNLRTISGLKVYVIAFVWAGVTVILPLLHADESLVLDVYIEAFQRFVLVVALMLPFEIRDLRFDSLRLATIPQQIGVKRTKGLGFLLILIFFLLEFLKDAVTVKFIFSTLIAGVLLLFLLRFSSKNQSPYYCGFWVEAIPIVWYVLLVF